MEKVHCLICGGEIGLGKMKAEEKWVRLADQEILFASRWFGSICAKCGPVLHRKGGHHDTINKKKLGALFPKAKRKQLLAALSADEQKLLKKTLDGKRSAKDGEVERWLNILYTLGP
jgi:hypothetical protein